MKTYLVLIREPDGRTLVPTEEETRQHQRDVKTWIDQVRENGHWEDGRALTLVGKVIRPTSAGRQVSEGPYRVQELEIVGGYMLLKGQDMDDVIGLLETCPIFDADCFMEVRELMG
ncbi:hypothetical protein GCM10028803_43290 [Larkinella knui]|uniref:YCII-related domain-containing protein n=1 Tax=Larkinella knui TaxID=2025310 RepID=A0A3P1CNP3_9BACT|nr:hypothetical protein [Larkinella knui]RRB14953.1 hypothetical protein EHT87_10335 [Larkinella knui]